MASKVIDKPITLGYSVYVSTLRFDGVTFKVYFGDHEPRHVHGFYAETQAIVDLKADGTVALADRSDRVQPRNAKVGDVRKILNAAAAHFDKLAAEWEKNRP